jgi:protein-tyrosine kinase
MNDPRPFVVAQPEKPRSWDPKDLSELQRGLLGALLIDAGALRLDDLDAVLGEQRLRGGRFGEAARRLGLVHPEAVDSALAKQFEFSRLEPSDTSLSKRLISAFRPQSVTGEAIRALRSQLALRWFSSAHGGATLAVAGVGHQEGRSFIAANLAVAFAQMGRRTLLIDADLRHPKLHEWFRLPQQEGLASMLAGRSNHTPIVTIDSIPGLSVLPAGAPPPNPQELLARPAFDGLLAELAERFSVILIDTSATQDSADAHWVTQRARGALLVARRDRTRLDRLRALELNLQQLDVHLVGSVYNAF